MEKEQRKAGKTLESALRRAVDMLESGERSGLVIADAVEEYIQSTGLRNAFPCNIGKDWVAAHHSPTDSDPTDLRDAGLVKIDAGSHDNGWIADAAFTFVFDESLANLARASYEALRRAIDAIRPGIEVAEIGKIVHRTAKKYGVKPISNLGGHQIERYNLHAGLFIPNIPEGKGIVEEGMTIAIEPFMSDGRGFVTDGRNVTIFSAVGKRARTPLAKKVLSFVEKEYKTLPFSQKWLERQFGPSVRLALFELARQRSIHQYPILLEQRGAHVAQFETTIYVDKDSVEPLVEIDWMEGLL